MQLSIAHNIDSIVRHFGVIRQDQIPFAAARALTESVKQARDRLVAELPSIYQNPTPYTLNAFYLVPATKRKLSASIGIKDFASKGTPAERYLRPTIEGGSRNLKRAERALQAMGLMPAGRFAVPAAGADIDQYGNMRVGQIVAMLAALKALPGAPYTVNLAYKPRARRGKRRAEQYFAVIRPRGGLQPGVYQRLTGRNHGRVVPVLIYVGAPQYQQRFDFYGLGSKYALEAFDEAFRKAYAQAVSTAR